MNPETRTYPPIGTVSEGTMRPEDLIPAFLGVIEQYAPDRYADLCADFDDTAWDDVDLEFLSEFLDELFGIMDEIAAPYTYFGASEGDGACYGFWPDIAGLEEDARYRDGVVKVSDDIDYVMSVSDHGNVTLYDAHTRAEIWSVV
jgi:hypothetical protein